MPRPITCPATKGVFKTINHSTSNSLFESVGMVLLSVVFSQITFAISHTPTTDNVIPKSVATTRTGKVKTANPSTLGKFRLPFGEMFMGEDCDVTPLYDILKGFAIRSAKEFTKKWGAQDKGNGTLLSRVRASIDTGFPIVSMTTRNIETGDECEWEMKETGDEGEEETKLTLVRINDKPCKQYSVSRRWKATGGMADNVCRLVPKPKGNIKTEMVCATKA